MGAAPGAVMSAIGADCDDLTSIAEAFERSARRIDQLTRRCSMLPIGSFAGPDGELFARRISAVAFETSSCAERLGRSAQMLRHQADQQHHASQPASQPASEPASEPGPASITAPIAAPIDASLRQTDFWTLQQALVRDAAQQRLDSVDGRLNAERARLRRTHNSAVDELIHELTGADTPTQRVRRHISELDVERGRLASLLNSNRTFLRLDARGDGRIIEVLGDISRASHIAIFVPGFSTTIENYADGRAKANPIFSAAGGDQGDVAVIDFLDWDPPDISAPGGGHSVVEAGLVAGERRATDGAKALAALVDELRSSGIPAERITVIGHSYGSTAVGIALSHFDLDVGRVGVVGSPGLGAGVDHLAELDRPDVAVWAAAANGDFVRYAPAHGADPADADFGARTFSTEGSVGHSQYLSGESLENIVRIIEGQRPT